jgi:hypothetical protein
MPTSLTAEFLVIARPTDDKIALLAKQFKLTPEQIELCIQLDPSPNQTDFVTWIARQLSKGNLRLPEDGPGTRDTLTAFQTQRRRPAFGGSKDINAYATPGDLAEAVQQNAMVVVRNKDAEKFRNIPGARMVVQKGDLTVFQATTAEACALLSDSTQWCTRHSGTAAGYIGQGPSYIGFYHGGPYAQLHPPSNQFMDKRDNPLVKVYRAKRESGGGWGRSRWRQGEVLGTVINGPVAQTMVELLRPKFPDVEKWYQKQKISDPKELAKRLNEPNNVLDLAVLNGVPLSPEQEARLFKNGDPEDYDEWEELWNYADKFHPTGRWELLENIIKKNLRKNLSQAIRYAKERIKGRWPEMEPFIIRNAAINDQHAGIALDYAVNAIKGRWPELEEKFKTTKSTDTMPNLAFKYAVEVLKQPWRDAEPQARFQYGMVKPELLMCLNTPETAIEYAEHFNLKPWPEFAQILLTKKQLDWYVRYLAKLGNKARDHRLEQRLLSPVPEVEKMVVKMEDYERRRWRYEHNNEDPPLFKMEEQTLNKDGLANQYNEEVLGEQRWPEFEQKLIREASDKESKVIPTSFMMMEDSGYYGASQKDRLPDPFATYISNAVKGRWPEFEQVLLQRYQDYPDAWKSNQALVSGYLNLVGPLVKGKEPEEEVRYNRNWTPMNEKPTPPTGVWAEGEAILRQRSPIYEAALTTEANEALGMPEIPYKLPKRDEPAYVKEERQDALWEAGYHIGKYIEFLRSIGNDWPEGVAVLNRVEDIRDARHKEIRDVGGHSVVHSNRLKPPKGEQGMPASHYGSLLDRLESHALLHRRRIQPL